MPRVTPKQQIALKLLRDSADALSNYGTVEAVQEHMRRLPILKASFQSRDGVGKPWPMEPYRFMKFVEKRWLRCIESDSKTTQTQRFRWRLTHAGKRACWMNDPPDGADDEEIIEV